MREVVELDSRLAHLIPGFLENRGRDIARLQEAAARRDHKTITDIAHALFGVAGSFGFARLCVLAKALEHAACAGEQGQIDSLLCEIERMCSNLEISFF